MAHSTATSPEFQRLTGHLVAQELHHDQPLLDYVDCYVLCVEALSLLGEPKPTFSEIRGMRDYFESRVPANLNQRRNTLTDTTATLANPLDGGDYGLGFTPEERILTAIFGPTPEIIEKVNNAIAGMSDDELRGYGERVANNHLKDPTLDTYNAEDFIKSAEADGMNLPELVKTTVREVVAAAPRITFEEAMNRAKLAAAHPTVAVVNSQERNIDPTVAYDNGYRAGREFQRGWNSAQFTGEQTVALLTAEGGVLDENTIRGLLDAYSHYTPAAVAA